MLDTYVFLIGASLIGIVRAVLSLIVEHPLDTIKTYWQAHPSRASIQIVGKEIYRLKGIRGFYSGAIPNIIRVSFKQAYRYPLLLVLPIVYAKIFNSIAMISFATGFSIAILEIWVLAPLERLKVWLMTFQKMSGGIKAFIRQLHHQMFFALYRGLTIMTLRQVTSWVTFLFVHDQLIYIVRHLLKVDHLSFVWLLGISVIEGGINTMLIMPIDCVKTNVQKSSLRQNRKSSFKIARYLYVNYGMRGLYVGWEAKMGQYMLHAFFTVSLLENLKEAFAKI